MLREIVLDTETTGTEAKGGDRLIEIGAVELLNHIPTGRTFHRYCNPQRPVSEGAFNVHGLSDAFLSDKPVFAAIVGDLLAFLADGRLVIHNAPFDVGFLNMEYARLGADAPPPIRLEDVVDTLPMARRKHPGAANNLDALCSRYGIDNTRRTKHGALLDAQILAEVYVELLGGKQTSLGLMEAASHGRGRRIGRPAGDRGRAPVPPEPADGRGAGPARRLPGEPRSRRDLGRVHRRGRSRLIRRHHPHSDLCRRVLPHRTADVYCNAQCAGGGPSRRMVRMAHAVAQACTSRSPMGMLRQAMPRPSRQGPAIQEPSMRGPEPLGRRDANA